MTRHFFIVGAQRSGSTYLYQILDEHPEIEMNKPVRPEPKFFLQEDSDKRVDEYVSTFFSSTNGIPLRGDKSASYIESKGAAQRISKCFPDAKILVILRDPVDRAISNYWFTVANKLETKSVEEALLSPELVSRKFEKDVVSVSPYDYHKRGRYVEYLDMYSDYFAPEQLRIVVFEKFLKNRAAIQDLYEFLGVKRDFIPSSIDEKVNEREIGDVPTPKKVTDFLTEVFRESNEQLATRYGVDISGWRR